MNFDQTLDILVFYKLLPNTTPPVLRKVGHGVVGSFSDRVNICIIDYGLGHADPQLWSSLSNHDGGRMGIEAGIDTVPLRGHSAMAHASAAATRLVVHFTEVENEVAAKDYGHTKSEGGGYTKEQNLRIPKLDKTLG